MHLAALSFSEWQRLLVNPGAATANAGREYVFDYLAEEVVYGLPGDLRKYLLVVGCLDEFCPALADHVSGRNDGEVMLRDIERRNLFLEPLDSTRAWYGFDRCFSDFLRAVARKELGDELITHTYVDARPVV